MNHSLKIKLREMQNHSVILSKVYHKAAAIKTRRLMKLSDEEFIRQKFKENVGYELNLDDPQTFNEKLQWLKLHDRNPLYTQLVDKYRVREYVAEKIGAEYLNELYGVYDHFDEIDFDELPDRFVLKCNHDCGSIVICKDKSKLDRTAARKTLESALKKNYYWAGREWPYKNVTPKIVAEKYLEDKTSSDLKDYKFFCFNGDPKVLFIATDRQNEKEETRFDFFDADFSHLPIISGHPNAVCAPEKPQSFPEMKELAKKLSDGIPSVRVDFYEVDGRPVFGEMTFFHWGGMMPFDPPEWDNIFGSWLVLPEAANHPDKGGLN